MANAHSHDSHDSSHGSVKSYAIGFILSVILTLIPFGLVMYPTLPKSITLMIVLAFAVIQVLVHLVYFLHLDRSKEQRENVIAFVFAGLVIVLLVGLSLWIMFSIHTYMMAK
ncbi:MAG: cytochrome o ubiquinol oxidase subunit IV [Pseudomonadales bacterium RIFCSPLOWO2_12_60_38]|jgi:cytochrome o ubiquinol oxidase operon protein cyoD|uniref:Cytochrome bo(3) ubiquinol oxidase subunit 4 n=13 Tax=Pseudomonas TaxID=286 RepID=A0A125QE41_PSEFL|nr:MULTISPECIES: cytochrome o ubiquinol oxidase subunit IV [Pseudomonas]AFJ58723.1 cytochrome o ubiquinol oxidase, subunit IV [Pseudomonas fluorescens A506]ETK41978.1 cytochrome O ubiquinol oxidase [Pseudomonas fluorescens FH5]MDN5420558.1 cytochrome o ubiquinol oxidase subunit IV [Pseudomonadales bacterium]OHC34267.1 MAG: cytochrome o ubiquinol oxidase subunit IV [Pseudomonadales bacterium RIFCSPLOWO2_12_60_38]OHC39969.1 MAG: cytochrome o ubiquinol oxidase subunit IV [Pseudomonadales bacteriu